MYRSALRALADGLLLGRGRHGVVVALTNDVSDMHYGLAVKIVHKLFTPLKGREPSFHRSVCHPLQVLNETAAMATLSDSHASFVIPLYCAFQDDQYVFLVMQVKSPAPIFAHMWRPHFSHLSEIEFFSSSFWANDK